MDPLTSARHMAEARFAQLMNDGLPEFVRYIGIALAIALSLAVCGAVIVKGFRRNQERYRERQRANAGESTGANRFAELDGAVTPPRPWPRTEKRQ